MANGRASGRGTMVWRNGAKYVGNWANGARDGQGVQSYASDSSVEKYDGSWQQNKWQGHGSLFYRDGSKYVGQFAADEFDGQGIFTFKPGSGTNSTKHFFSALTSQLYNINRNSLYLTFANPSLYNSIYP